MTGITLQAVHAGDTLPPLLFKATATRIVAGALASRDYSPLHHDRDYAVSIANQRDIFANTQFQSALFERYLQDWAGPFCRIARLKFAMRTSLYANENVVLTGKIIEAGERLACGPGALVALEMRVGKRLATSCEALVGLPRDDADNPWHRRGADWLRPN